MYDVLYFAVSPSADLYNSFYLSRYLQIVEVQHPEKKFRVMNLHLEAYSKENRELHLIKVQDRIRDFEVDISGGDFNGAMTLLPETEQAGFKMLAAPQATFPSASPTQVLDGFILNQNHWRLESIQTQMTGLISDHFPVVIQLV